MKKKTDLTIRHFPKTALTELVCTGAGLERTKPGKSHFYETDKLHITLTYVLSGKGNVSYDGKTYPVGENGVFVSFPSACTERWPDENEPWTIAWIDVIGPKAMGYFSRMGFTLKNRHVQLPEKNDVRKILLRLISETYDNADADVFAFSAFFEIAKYFAVLQGKTSENKNEYSENYYVDQAVQFINDNVGDVDLNIKTVAKHVNLNSSYFSRLFKKYNGTTFTDFLTATRLNAAVQLMDKGNYVITDVAYSVGFSSPYYFSKVFKKFNLITPTEHIEKLKRDKSVQNKNEKE